MRRIIMLDEEKDVRKYSTVVSRVGAVLLYRQHMFDRWPCDRCMEVAVALDWTESKFRVLECSDCHVVE